MDDETIALLARSHTILVPTLCTLFSVLELGEKLNLLPKQREEMAVNHPLWLDSLRRAHAAGVPIAAGADIGNRYPHGANARELEYLVQAGLSPMEALLAATSIAARVVRQADTLGALAPGKVADVLVLDGDPLADIRVLQDHDRIRLVMQGGRAVAGSLWAQSPVAAGA
jgi:imidazolonepropionase-like amidohydrolase